MNGESIPPNGCWWQFTQAQDSGYNPATPSPISYTARNDSNVLTPQSDGRFNGMWMGGSSPMNGFPSPPQLAMPQPMAPMQQQPHGMNVSFPWPAPAGWTFVQGPCNGMQGTTGGGPCNGMQGQSGGGPIRFGEIRTFLPPFRLCKCRPGKVLEPLRSTSSSRPLEHHR